MVNKIQILRSNTFGNRPAVNAQPYGAPYVNFGGLQLGVVDSTGTPRDLIGVTFFSTTANYTQGQPVNYQGQLYTANASIVAGVWNPAQWAQVSTSYLPLTGGTLTGTLTMNVASPNIILNKATGTNNITISGATNGLTRWIILPSDNTAESGSNAGSNFTIYRYNDAGTFIDAPFTIPRSNGTVTVGSGGIISSGSVATGISGTAGTYYFGNTATKYLNYDGTNFNLSGGNLTTSGSIQANGGNIIAKAASSSNPSPFIIFADFNGTSQGYVYWNNSNNAIYLQNATSSAGFYVDSTGRASASYGFFVKGGTAGAVGPNVFNFGYTTPTIQCWIDATNFGTLTLTSDYRIKKGVVDLPGMWDTVKKLRPIKYTHTEFSPPSHLAHIEKIKAEDPKAEVGPLFTADNIERWGFIAHELQATLVPSAANGEKDSPDTIQSPNPMTIIAALTKALQEAMARIEALEAR